MYQPNWRAQEPKELQPAREPNQIASPQKAPPSPKETEQQELQPARELITTSMSGIWEKIRQHPVMTAVIIGLVTTLIVVVVVVVLGYWFNWSWVGVNGGESKITITSTSKGITTATELQPAKTLWDWLGLLGVLAIPVVVGFGAAWFSYRQNLTTSRIAEDQHNRDQQLADQRAKSEQEVAKDNQHERALGGYIDNMSALLLDKQLHDSQLVEEKWKVARVRTLTVLPRLDSKRKRSVLQFLYESKLLDKDMSSKGNKIDISGADLSGADLSGADLEEADLKGADLSGADLSGADLSRALLSKALLSRAILSRVDLLQADLSGAILDGADLKEARLDRTDLTGGADLRRADLSGADLNYANLKGADLRGAKMDNKTLLKDTNLQGAQYNTKVIPEKDTQEYIRDIDQQGKPVMIEPTQWPQGFDPNAAGAICVDRQAPHPQSVQVIPI